jgi:RNA polymerase sigma factor (sigma-70 family)
MEMRLEYGEALYTLPGKNLDIRRLLPSENPDPIDRANAWQDCWHHISTPVLKYIRCKNGTSMDDREILEDAMATAYVEVERGNYEYRENVPFTAYVKGIARNMIREAYRRDKRSVPLDETFDRPDEHEFESNVELWEEHEALHMRLLELPARRRQVLLLCSEGHETWQIAHDLGIREDLVRQEKSRALQQLRRKMA